MNDSDDDGVLTVVTSSDIKNKSGISEAKRKQLALAREKAIVSRRIQQKINLEARLSKLKQVLGGLDSEQLDRITNAMLQREDRLREKQNEIVRQYNELLSREASKRQAEAEWIKNELRHIRAARPATCGKSTASVADSSSTQH